MKRPARKRSGLGRVLRCIAAPVRCISSPGRLVGAARFAVIWFTALALIFQTTFATVSANANPNSSGVSALCMPAGEPKQGPLDSDDRSLAGGLKCIACVIGHSLAPPLPSMAPLPALAFAGFSEAWPFSAPVPDTAPYYSHSARGPPATA
jgi:hypothetical protein